MKKIIFTIFCAFSLLGCNSQSDDDFVNSTDLNKASKTENKGTSTTLSVKVFDTGFKCSGGGVVTSNGQYPKTTFFNYGNPELLLCRGNCEIISTVLINEISKQFYIDEKFYQTDSSWGAPTDYSNYMPQASEFNFEYIDYILPNVTFPYSGAMPSSTVQGLIDDSLIKVQNFLNQNPNARLIAITAHPNGYLCYDTNRGVAVKIKYRN